MRTGKSIPEPMNGDADLETLLGEIPDAASSLNLHTSTQSCEHHHHQRQKSKSVMDHVYGHAPSFASHGMPSGSGHHPHGHGHASSFFSHGIAGSGYGHHHGHGHGHASSFISNGLPSGFGHHSHGHGHASFFSHGIAGNGYGHHHGHGHAPSFVSNGMSSGGYGGHQYHHGHGHASSLVSNGMSSGCYGGHQYHHGHGYADSMYDNDQMLRQRYAFPSSSSTSPSSSSSSSPMKGFSSTSLFSANGLSLSQTGSSTSSQLQQQRRNQPFFCEKRKALADDFNIALDLSKMYVSDRQEAGSSSSLNCNGFSDQYTNRALRMNLDKDKLSDQYMNLGHAFNGMYCPDKSPRQLAYENSGPSPQFQRPYNLVPMRYPVSDGLDRPVLGDVLPYGYQNGMNLTETNYLCPWPDMVHMLPTKPYYNYEKPLSLQPLNGRFGVPHQHAKMPQQNVNSFATENTLILQGDTINHGMNKGQTRPRGQNGKSSYHGAADKLRETNLHIDRRFNISSTKEICKSPRKPILKCSSLEDARGRICQLAKDQHGCRDLQRLFDEGNGLHLIFNEIIDHIVELMINPFGNYLVQKVLDVCDEEQRLRIIHRVTQEPGQLVEISLNTHGTRVVQKLIETLTSKMQIGLVVSALEPGFLQLIKDLNGNHVIQRCLQSFSPEDNEFIFIAAANGCIEIGTHQQGCVVLQSCISYSAGELKENLVAVISENALLFAHDPFGNYVVQFVLDLKHQSSTSKITSQFRGRYVNLSMLKHSSHVVEKCLQVCDNEVKSTIIDELLSYTDFEQLLRDPHANYVIQTALKVEGPLHNYLVEMIESYRVDFPHCPCKKGIFSSKFLKRR